MWNRFSSKNGNNFIHTEIPKNNDISVYLSKFGFCNSDLSINLSKLCKLFIMYEKKSYVWTKSNLTEIWTSGLKNKCLFKTYSLRTSKRIVYMATGEYCNHLLYTSIKKHNAAFQKYIIWYAALFALRVCFHVSSHSMLQSKSYFCVFSLYIYIK